MSEKEIDSDIVSTDLLATIVLSNDASKSPHAKSAMSHLPAHVLGSDAQRLQSKSA